MPLNTVEKRGYTSATQFSNPRVCSNETPMKFITNKTSKPLLDRIFNITSANDEQIPYLYLDFEGRKLSWNGSPGLLTIMTHPQMDTYIIDILTLGKATFDTKNCTGMLDLKSVLESNGFCKVLYDVRRDSNALFVHFDVHLPVSTIYNSWSLLLG
jgi:hypothetical protein